MPRLQKGALIAAAILLCAPDAGAKGAPWTVRAAGTFGSTWGFGSFGLGREQQLEEVGGELEVWSELRWSREALMAGAEVVATRGPVVAPSVELELELLTNLGDPAGGVTLEDTVSSFHEAVPPTTLWWTEASARLRHLATELSARTTIYRSRPDARESFFLRAGLRHVYERLEATGPRGWRLRDHLVRERIAWPWGATSERYESHALAPYLGAGMRLGLSRRVFADFQALMGPAFSWEERESLAKRRRMSGETYGYLISLELDPYWVLPFPSRRDLGIVLGVSLLGRVLVNVGTLAQTDTGPVSAPVADSELQVLRFCFSALLRVGLRYRL